MQYVTSKQIADQLDVPAPRVRHILSSRGFDPAATPARIYLYDESMVDEVRREIQRQDSQRPQQAAQ